ncbi:MAG: biotin synthase BioB [Candidatus Manganitrophaceae bacterium]
MRDFIRRMEEKAIAGERLTGEEGCLLIEVSGPDLFDLISSANRVRHYYRGDQINLCSIVNAKSGNCSEDCNFCAQSAYHDTGIPTYPLIDSDGIVQAAKEAGSNGAEAFGIVAAWRGLREGRELEATLQRIRELVAAGHTRTDASLGIIEDKRIAFKLKEAGLAYYNHNLETARSYFPNICTTHTYDDRVRTIEYCKEAGIRICSGGIFGMGESPEQRIELAVALQELDVDVVPLNFLHAIEGTPFAEIPPLRPMEILKIIAVYRLMLPSKDIMTAGGREVHLRDLQSWMFAAGASHTLIGNYLTTLGRKPGDDLKMIEDLDLRAVAYCGEIPDRSALEMSIDPLSQS